jgi:aldehyde dehydrogenase (NAD+)
MTAQQLETIQSAVTPQQLIQQQRHFFHSRQTYSYEFRLEQLQRLLAAILDAQAQIVAAVTADLGRPEFEAYIELGTVAEIKDAIKRLRSWMKPQRVSTEFNVWPASAWVQPDPLGVVLIIGPWNYPFQLLIAPLIGAIAAGNCVILKPSELAPHCSKVITQIIKDTFDPSYIAVVEGGVEPTQQLLAEKFDHIFFTGGTRVGKIVMQAAAQHLTPVTLELGGKSPCIVEPDVDITTAAHRIVWAKFLNAGQTCIAPDYLLVNRQIKAQLLTAIEATIAAFYGNGAHPSSDMARIVNDQQFSRLTGYLHNGTTLVGGTSDSASRYIAPTVLDQVDWTDPIMAEEIFGPILPVLDYDDLGEAIAQINARPKPLALYFFSRDRQKQQQILATTSSGGVCLNDAILQVATRNLPFGGVGDSGMGQYHGKVSFDVFSHQKSVLRRFFLLDRLLSSWRYPPYKNKLQLIKKVVLG